MPANLPPYLTSGASSRVHHALLVKLHEATSSQEERQIISNEIARLKDVLGVPGQNTGRIAECLIVLLHISMIRTDVSDDLDFAMIHALQLAENGRRIQDRRIGYLYVQERMNEGDELGLMIINTIRKDLTSDKPAHILMALHTIVKLPSHDISPAVTPILTSRRLLKHTLPGVRQRTLEAIGALHLHRNTSGFPLSMSKIVKILSTEEDQSVLLVVLRTLWQLLELGIHQVGSETELLFLAEQIIIVSDDRENSAGQIGLESVRALATLLSLEQGPRCAPQVSQYLRRLLPNLDPTRNGDAALLLEVCRLAPAVLKADQELLHVIFRHFSAILSPPQTSSSVSHVGPKPNLHVLVLRCLDILPVTLWDGRLGDTEMGLIMEGLNSSDETIRRATLRLLDKLSPDLLNISFDNLLSGLRTSSDLCLPLNPPTSFEEKTTAGRLETSSRALEVAEVQHCGGVSANDDSGAKGRQFAADFVKILLALNEGVVNSTVVLSGSGPSTGGQVWEEGLRRVLAILGDRGEDFKMGFAREILQHRIGSATLVALRCSILSDINPPTEVVVEAVQVLLDDLRDFGASVQELVLVALVVQLSRVDFDASEIIQTIREVQLEAGKYIKKRCGHVVDIIQQNMLPEVMSAATSSSLPDVLSAMDKVHTAWRRSQRPASASQSAPTTPASPPLSTRTGPSSLRYAAYDRPSSSAKGSISAMGSQSRAASSRRPLDISISAGDLALFDADDEEADGRRSNDLARSSRSQSRPPTLSISKSEDTSSKDEARTPTMRQSRHVQGMDHLR